MFDNPKKELERLEQQLLAAENYEKEPEELQDDILEEYEEFEEFEEDPCDDELYALLNGSAPVRGEEPDWDFVHRSAGFDAEMEEYEMDADRYVPPQRKKNGCLITFALVQALLVIGLVVYALGRML